MNVPVTKKKLYCQDCGDGEAHSTGSIIVIFCPYQKGVRQLNDVCNVPEEKWLNGSLNQ